MKNLSSAGHVVILGAGFGGLHAAKALASAPVKVTLVDRRNHHLFQPLLYQVATAALNPGDIAVPIRSILRSQRNVTVLMAQAVGFDLETRRVVLADGSLEFDYLVVATGATHSYFGHADWEALAPGLKSIEDAVEIRRRVLLAYEAAEREPDPIQRQQWLTFVVVGAGPTGVEMAGAIAEIARYTLASDFRHFDPRETRVVLLDMARRVLPAYPESLSEQAQQHLARLGVEVQTGAGVSAIDEQGVTLGQERIAARTVIWAAGVAASPLGRALGVALDRAGRVHVQPDLSIPGHPTVFVIGDLAHVEKPEGGLVPGVAQAAIREGRHVARNITRLVQGRPTQPFSYEDKGSMATIGRAAAVADLGRVRLSGFVAWLAWLVVHLLFLVGFRNRVAVLLSWIWSYITYGRGTRLITGVSSLPLPPATESHPATSQRATWRSPPMRTGPSADGSRQA